MTSLLYIKHMHKLQSHPAANRLSSSDQRRKRSEQLLTIPAAILLAISLLAGGNTRAGEPFDGWAMAWVISSFLALSCLILTVIISYRQSDELQRLVQLRSMAIAFGVTVAGLFAAGIIEGLGVTDAHTMLSILFPVSILTWILADQWHVRRSK